MNILQRSFLRFGRSLCAIPKINFSKTLVKQSEEMELKNVVSKLNQFASPSLAESWDNVGLLTEPSAPHMVNTILLTNDLTAPVLDEAIGKNANMILSYHPPIFSSLKRLTQRSWKEKLIVMCIENRIAVYSPHTCYDALSGGVNDWLISAFGYKQCKVTIIGWVLKMDTKSIKPVEQTEREAGDFKFQLDVVVEKASAAQLVSSLQDKSTPQRITTSPVTLHEKTEHEMTRVSVSCNRCDMTRLVGIAQADPQVVSIEKREIGKIPMVGYGMGRVAKLTSPLVLEEAVVKVKTHLGLQHVRLAATPDGGKISSVAVCAGSGSSVLRNAKADLFVTGEMSHHDVLNAVSNGTSVILCEHSNTERGYLTVLAKKLSELLSDEVKVVVSETDSDPLKIV